MKPEEILDPTNLPEDLQWVVEHHRLQPNDPVFLLIAWHWNRVKASEDTLRLAILELKSMLDARVEMLADSADAVTGLNAVLGDVQSALESKPDDLRRQFDSQLKQPLAGALAELRKLEESLAPLARSFHAAQRRQLLAALLIGVALGILTSLAVALA
jgi:hypothetical protein